MQEYFDWGFRVAYALPMQGRVHVERDFFLGVTGNVITHIGPFEPTLEARSKTFIHEPEKVLLPGLVNGHTHLAMNLFRGLEDDVPLQIWLFERIFPLEAEFVTPEFVRTGTELAALECIRFGTTTVSDMYFYAQSSIDVWDQFGLRGIFSQALMSHPIPEDKTLGPDRFARFDALFNKYCNHDRISIAIAPHAPYTCDDELLRQAAQKSEEAGALIHIHVAETAAEVAESIAKHGKTPVEHLYNLGVLGPRTVCAHGVHVSDSDRHLLKRSGARVIHNPDSNFKLGSGTAPIPDYLRDGIPVGLGTDGAASNNDLSLFGAMDLASKAQKLAHRDNAAMTAAQALWMATKGGADALGLGDRIGSLEVGKYADFILVDFAFPHLKPLYDPVSHLVYATQGLEVDTVFCHGKPLLREKQFVALDPIPIFEAAEAYRAKIAAFFA
jgi:5-methylthioadenosine/S-adenosylhomocysteine deaminase